jgi:hypothetical protein
LQEDASAGDAEFLGRVGAKALDDRLDFAAQDALVRAGEARVCQVSGAAGEDLLVGRLHVSVGADDGGNLAVQHAGQGDFFGSRLGVHVNENDMGHWRRRATSARAQRKGFSSGARKVRPWRLRTATGGRPSERQTTLPWPMVPGG